MSKLCLLRRVCGSAGCGMLLPCVLAIALSVLGPICGTPAGAIAPGQLEPPLLTSEQSPAPEVVLWPGEQSSAWRAPDDTYPLVDHSQPPEVDKADEPYPPPQEVEGWESIVGGGQTSGWKLMPRGLIYRAYLAGAKQSRVRGVLHEDHSEGSLWDITLGGHFGLFRNGSTGTGRPVGSQLDLECSAQLRLDRDSDEDMVATDYRFGIPYTWGNEVYQTKFGWYHLSSHIADEFLDNNPGFTRVNFVRETLIWGHSYYLEPRLRVYAEVGFAFISDTSEPWEFQFGVDYSPACGTGTRGAPFAAFNVHIREELAYDGNVVAQFGWAWRESPASGLLRIGVEYYNGRDEQFSLFRNSQNKLGVGAWYDY